MMEQLVIFSRAIGKSIGAVMHCFKELRLFAGLEINKKKSYISLSKSCGDSMHSDKWMTRTGH